MKKPMRCGKAAAGVVLLAAAGMWLSGCAKTTVYRLAESAEVISETAEDLSATAQTSDVSLPEEAEPPAAGNAAEPQEPPAEETIWVYVCGAVRAPGVYELPGGSRVFAALEAAGGAAEGAELRSLNQAALLADGEQITVYTVDEIGEAGGVLPLAGTAEAASSSGRVNLNTAGKDELMTLAGIGEARAQAILEYRETNGPFMTIEEIMNIEGIKEKSFSRIKDEIEV